MLHALVLAAALVSVEAPVDIALTPGASKEVAIDITVADGFHVQANPAANEFLIPLELEWDYTDGLEIGPVHYPPGKTFRISGTEANLLTYEDTFTVTASLRALDSAKRGTRRIRGRLQYQACDDHSCRRPASIAFELNVSVAPPVD